MPANAEGDYPSPVVAPIAPDPSLFPGETVPDGYHAVDVYDDGLVGYHQEYPSVHDQLQQKIAEQAQAQQPDIEEELTRWQRIGRVALRVGGVLTVVALAAMATTGCLPGFSGAAPVAATPDLPHISPSPTPDAMLNLPVIFNPSPAVFPIDIRPSQNPNIVKQQRSENLALTQNAAEIDYDKERQPPKKTEKPVIPTAITPEQPPIPEEKWCNDNYFFLGFYNKVQEAINAKLDPIKKLAMFPSLIVLAGDDERTPDIVEKLRCGGGQLSTEKFEGAKIWGFTDSQLDACKRESLKIVSEDNWLNSKIWLLEPNTRKYLDFDPATHTCSWLTVPLTNEKKDLYSKGGFFFK